MCKCQEQAHVFSRQKKKTNTQKLINDTSTNARKGHGETAVGTYK